MGLAHEGSVAGAGWGADALTPSSLPLLGQKDFCKGWRDSQSSWQPLSSWHQDAAQLPHLLTRIGISVFLLMSYFFFFPAEHLFGLVLILGKAAHLWIMSHMNVVCLGGAGCASPTHVHGH